jgi:hypothetical protein
VNGCGSEKVAVANFKAVSATFRGCERLHEEPQIIFGGIAGDEHCFQNLCPEILRQ